MPMKARYVEHRHPKYLIRLTRLKTANYRQLDILFPEALREPILRRVQFSTIGRLEHLGVYQFSNPSIYDTNV